MPDDSKDAFLQRLSEVIADAIAPAAVAVDRAAVPPTHFEALAVRTDLLRVGIDERWGGLELPIATEYRGWAQLAAACPSTHLIAQQHSTPGQWLRESNAADAASLLPRLATGELIGAAAFGHVRNWPHRRNVMATRIDGGWLLDGVAPWLSGWGLASLLAVAAVDPVREQIVYGVVELPGSIAPIPIELSSIAGSRTVAARFDRVVVPDSRVTKIVSLAGWRDGDGLPPIDPAVLGLADAAIGFARKRYPEDPGLAEIAGEIDQQWIVALTSPPRPGDPTYHGRSRQYWRTASAALAVRATQAAIIAAGGVGLRTDHITQIWARAAMFHQVRGLDNALRTEHFARLAGK